MRFYTHKRSCTERKAFESTSEREIGKRRQDTWSDLQLFGIVNLAVIFLFSWLKAHLVDVADSGTSAEELNKPFWTILYEVHAKVLFIASVCSLIVLPTM